MSEPTLLQEQRQILQRFRQATQQRDQQECIAEDHLNAGRAEADEKLKQKQLITLIRRIKAIKEQDAQYTSEQKSANEAWKSVHSQADDCLRRVQKAEQSLQYILQKSGLQLPFTQIRPQATPIPNNLVPSTELSNAVTNAEQNLARFAESVKALNASHQIATFRRRRLMLWAAVVTVILAIIGFINYRTWQEQKQFVQLEARATAISLQVDATATAIAPLYKPLEDRFGMRFVLVPGGEFMMGSKGGEGSNDERPQHSVKLDPFLIGVTEVTVDQYNPFVEAGGYSNRAFWSEYGWEWLNEDNSRQPWYWKKERHDQPGFPVVCVNWYEIHAYLSWLSQETKLRVRLPTEAEWELAARGVDGRIYPWGDQSPTKALANFRDWKGNLQLVGSYPTGVSPYGVLDMAGNVWEETLDRYDASYYTTSPMENPISFVGSTTVVRGGSMYSFVASEISSTNRELASFLGCHHVGFRIVVKPSNF